MIALLLLLWLPPEAAAWLVALGDPDVASDLLAICHRESRCERIGVHARDAHLDGWHGQVRLGHLDPSCQPWAPRTWTTRGSWGLSAASSWPWLPQCYPAAALDVPLVSAVVARLRLADVCADRPDGWCP